MTSQLLLEGVLDVKVPRGSEDRKLWKVWRRQWISFSVIYPSGRREPLLLLEMARRTSETPENQIQISRDGLRIFRCRSRSRPYRTWAIMSGNKPLLFFAAESEVRAQEWMQSVRDGLWPPCFSLQMLSACAHEISLIDDENTFLSGLLGVYGYLVLTSEDVISLMHPHWGATMLQITLTDVQDVQLVREAEVSPAGTFSIILKGAEGSSLKTLQFYSNTAKYVIQWISSKVLLKDVHSTDHSILKISNSETNASVKSLLLNYTGDSSLTKTPNKMDSISNDIDNDLSETNSEYESMKCRDSKEFFPLLKPCSKYSNTSIGGENSLQNIYKETQIRKFSVPDSAENEDTIKSKLLENVEPNLNITEDILYECLKYKNLTPELDAATADNTFTYYHASNDPFENAQLPNKECVSKALISWEVSSDETLRSSEYAGVYKRSDSKEKFKNTLEAQCSLVNRLDDEYGNERQVSENKTSDLTQYASQGFSCRNITAPAMNMDSYKNSTDLFYQYDTNCVYANTNFQNRSYVQETNTLGEEFCDKTLNSSEYAMVNKLNVSKHTNDQVLSTNDLKHDVTATNHKDSLKSIDSIDELNTTFPVSKIETIEKDEHKVSTQNIFNTNIECNPHFLLNDAILHDKHYSITSSEIRIPHSTPCKAFKPVRHGAVAETSLYRNLINQSDNSHSLINTSSTIDSNCRNGRPILLPIIHSDCSDTNITSTRLNTVKSDNLSLEDGVGNSKLWLEDDCINDPEFTNHIYEHLLDRKGTIYEEIDETGDEYIQELPPPHLPERPPNLEIPSSLRLHKLSQSITEVLQEMKLTPSPATDHIHRQKLVKKIKEKGRIMHV